MSDVQLWIKCLNDAFIKPDGKEAERIILNIQSYFEEGLAESEIDAAILHLFSKSSLANVVFKGLPNFVEISFSKTGFNVSTREIFSLFSTLLDSFTKKLDEYVEDIVSVCLKVLRSACEVKIKEKAMLVLFSVVEGSWQQHVPPLVELLLSQVPRRTEKPSLRARQYQLIGILCQRYPEHMESHSEILIKSLLLVIQEEKAKVSFPVLEGCFSGLNGYMQMRDLEPHMVDTVYKGIKGFSDPKDQNRRGFSREALKLLSKHASVFSERLCDDLVYWHPLLLKWINQVNSDDRTAGCWAIFSFYESVSADLIKRGPCEITSKCLEYLMNYFKSVIHPSSQHKPGSHESKIALKGFALVASKCQELLGREQFESVGEGLAQRALLALEERGEDNPEEVTSKLEELCNHVEALAVIGRVAEESLVLLLRILISDFPKCMPHRHYLIINAMKKSLPVINMENLISYFIKESCSHAISVSLDGSTEFRNSELDPSKWTFEIFMPLWKGILDVPAIFRCYMMTIIKIIPNLDFSTHTLSMAELQNKNNSDIAKLETLELPINQSSYRLFTNMCDLTATILSLPCMLELCRPWLAPLFAMAFRELQHWPVATGYLRIAHAALRGVKLLEIFSEDNYNFKDEELLEMERNILQLLKSLSITNCSGIHQLRSALVILYAPPVLLDKDLLIVASDGFQVVLRVGKTNLDLVFTAMEILEEWDFLIERHVLRPLCQKILPMLNEYLCSSGISDSNVLGSDGTSNISTYNYSSRKRRILAEGTSPQLAMLQNKIMLFLGKMDSTTVKPLISGCLSPDVDSPDDLEEKSLTDLTERLKISLPCPTQHKLDIYLDSLISRIRELAMSSTNRDTRLTACQALHSVILLVYGTNVSLPASSKGSLSAMLSDLTVAMVSLSADTDSTVAAIFDPLLIQSCHWFSAPANANTTETEKFISALMKGAFHPSDSTVREKSCLALKEFVAWTVRQASDDELQKLPSGAAAILRSICQMALHPDPYRRRGAFLVFNHIASQLYKIESAIDKFLPELLYTTVKCIYHSMTLFNKEMAIYKEEAMKSLHVILKCLQMKTVIFKKPSKTRRKPPGFDRAVLDDIAIWLLKQSRNCLCRKTAEKLFKTFMEITKQIDGSKSCNIFITNLINNFGLDNFISNYLEPLEVINNFSILLGGSEYIVKTLLQLISSIDIHILIIQNQLIDPEVLFTPYQVEKSILFQNLKCFDAVVNDNKSYVKHLHILFHGAQMDILDDLYFKIIWKSCQLFTSIAHICEINESLNQCWRTAVLWLTELRKLRIMRRNIISDKGIWSVKETLENMKKNLSNQHWNLFVQYFKTKLDAHDVRNIFNVCTKSSIMYYCNEIGSLSQIVDIVNIIDSVEVFSIFKKWQLPQMFRSIVDKFFLWSNRIKVANMDPSFMETLGLLIEFILNARAVSIQQLLEILLTPIIDPETSPIPRAIFLKTFDVQIIPFLISHHLEIFNELKSKYGCDTMIIEGMLHYFSVNRCNDTHFLETLVTFLIEIWPQLTVSHDFNSLVKLYSLLAMVLPSPLEHLGRDSHMTQWLLTSLEDRTVEILKKSKLLVLLPTVCPPGLRKTCYDDAIVKALHSVTSHHFPLKSDEFAAFTPERANFLSAFKILLEAMANSGSYIILQTVIQCSCFDKEHVCDSQISHKLGSFMASLNSSDQTSVLEKVFHIFTERSRDPSIRLNLLHRFVIPLLNAACVTSLENFYADNLPKMIELLDKKMGGVKPTEIALKHLFLEWNAAFQMAENMFLKVPNVQSPSSRIGQLGDKLKVKWRRNFFERSLLPRSVNIPLHNNIDQTAEYLRLARCSAYKCHYSVVFAMPKEDIVLYKFLLSQDKLWEGMIDTNKQYTFPLDQVSKIKYHSIKTKHRNNFIASTSSTLANLTLNSQTLSQSFLGVLHNDEDRRKRVFSQTLSDDMLKYDLNMATVRDSPALHLNSDHDQAKLCLEDSDLNNHECMAAVCSIIMTMDALTSPVVGSNTSVSSSTSLQSGVPQWVDCIVQTLSDQNRHPNVRLFLCQVMVNVRDNGSDVFMKYSKVLLEPILKTIEHRCTSFDTSVNFLDVCILLMLLSWSEEALPSTPTEVSSASSVLKLLIDQIDPNSQSAELFKHSLELLKEILSVWGQHLTIPSLSILTKLEGQGVVKKAGVQISAAVLATENIPWDNNESYIRFCNAICKGMLLPEKYIYKPCAEVIGMTLKFLLKNASHVSQHNNTNENENYKKYTSLLDEIRKILKKMFNDVQDKFITCLYMIQNYCPDICDNTFANMVSFIMSKLPTDGKKMCLKIFLSAMDAIEYETLNQELKALNVLYYLKDKDFRVACLHIINKASSRFELNELLPYIEDLCELSSHKDGHSRAISYEILMRAYDLLKECREDILDIPDDQSDIYFTCQDLSSINGSSAAKLTPRKRPFESTRINILNTENESRMDSDTRKMYQSVKYALLIGVDDDDEVLRNRVFDFWTTRLTSNIEERWLFSTRELLPMEKSGHGSELGRLLKLVLGTCRLAPDFSRTKLFDNPLEQCTFSDYKLNVTRCPENSTLAPMFAETLNSQLQLMSLVSEQGRAAAERTASQLQHRIASNRSLQNAEHKFLRATLESVGFTFSESRNQTEKKLENNAWNGEGFSLGSESSLLFTVEPQLLHRKTYKPLPQGKANKDGNISGSKFPGGLEEKLRRKFISDKNLQRLKFSGIAASKKKYLAEKRLAEKPAQIFRNFRDGDFPDIQIGLDDILAPLLGLATRDPLFAKDFFVIMFRSLIEHSNQSTDVSAHQSCENVTEFKMHTARAVLSCLDQGRPGSILTVALLQLCQMCLKECAAVSEDCKTVISSVAKSSGAAWLGKLLLEEMAIVMESEGENQGASKKQRIEISYEDGIQLPVSLTTEIRSLKTSGKWKALLDLYGTATLDDHLGFAEKKHCTEEYFHCYARLSDWEELVNQIGDHLTLGTDDDNSTFCSTNLPSVFDYGVLWKSEWSRDTLLHYVFAAHLQRMSCVTTVKGFSKTNADTRNHLKEAIEVFDGSVNNWMGDPEKSDFLLSTLVPCLALWRAVSRMTENDISDSSLLWIRGLWAAETNADQYSTARIGTLNTMLALAETRSFLECHSIMGNLGSRHTEESIRQAIARVGHSWGHCLPHLEDDTLAWDVRLACRSVYTAHLQDYLKSQMTDSESESEAWRTASRLIESLRETQRMAELRLVKAAILQRNFELSEKFIKKHIQYLNENEELSWGLQLTKLMRLKAENETDMGGKINFILEAWQYGENVRKECYMNNDAKSLVDLLVNSAEMADQLCSQLGDPYWGNPDNILLVKNALVEVVTHDSDVSASAIEECVMHPDRLRPKLIEYSSHRLKQAVKLAEDTYKATDSKVEWCRVRKISKNYSSRRELEFKAETYMRLARYCRKVKEEYGNSDDLILLIITGVTQAMTCGHQEAKKLFPVLLLELESLPINHPIMEVFKKELNEIPLWYFLPWSAQIMAHLPTLRSSLYHIAKQLATNFPAALRHHYRLSRQTWEPLPSMANIIVRFDHLLVDRNTETMAKALGSLCCPKTVLKNSIEKLLNSFKSLDISRWVEALGVLFKHIYPNDDSNSSIRIRGPVFNVLDKYKASFESLLESDVSTFQHQLEQIYLSVTKLDDIVGRRSLANFSPYLARYGEEQNGALEVFGQYEEYNQNVPPNIRNHITIERFDSEVTVKSTLRRPVRICMIGSDGKRYGFLVKCGEDLRQDDRIQQLFQLMNHPLKETGMAISTFKVFPLSHNVGLIEWVEGCATLRELACHADPKTEEIINQARAVRDQKIGEIPGSLLEKYGKLAANVSEAKVLYYEAVNKFPKYLLRQALMKLAVSPENFVKMRGNFVKSLAPMNIAHWILGIGDRHLSNCLISLSSGSVLGVDFGYAFGTATQLQHLPELLPFRLTPQLLGVLAPQGSSTASYGILRELMWQALGTFCNHRSLLLAAMEVFVREPALDWLQHSDTDNPSWSPADKINQCKRKLCGIDPSIITMEDLNIRSQGTEYTTYFCKVLQEAVAPYRKSLTSTDSGILTVDQQVDHLITLATDPGILSITYSGWSPWF